ncbi:lipid-A-disaccharide synthase [Elusimicrobiota bacterium]
MTQPPHLLVIAGEISSDRHGFKLIAELKKKGSLKVTSIGGQMMGTVSDHMEENIVEKATVGFSEVIKLIPFFLGLKKRIVDKYFSSESPDRIDGLILIDYPGFNMSIAKEARKFGIQVFYYITPQVWAWGKNRIPLLAGICKKLYCLFEFEKDLFEKAGAHVEWVGHPILEDMPSEFNIDGFSKKFSVSDDDKLIAILPGSRVSEVKRHLPVIISAIKDIDCRVILGKAPSVSSELIRDIAGDIELCSDVYPLLKRADIAILSSGTSTLEAAVIGTPFITVYKVSAISYLIAKLLVDVKYISMVNILAGIKLVPELIQGDLNQESLKKEISRMLGSSDIRVRIKKGLEEVSSKIGTKGASSRTAESIFKEINQVV